MRYCRDMHGFGQTPPQTTRLNAARVAVQFVLNHEEGGETACCMAMRHPKPSCPRSSARRNGRASAAGTRLHRPPTEKNVPGTVYGVATARRRSPTRVAAMPDAGWEIASHGLKWAEQVERIGQLRLQALLTA